VKWRGLLRSLTSRVSWMIVIMSTDALVDELEPLTWRAGSAAAG
jgi:hypothetical protein